MFTWDRSTGTVETVSLRHDGSVTANGGSSSPALSHDGQVVAFLSTGTDLVAGMVDTNNLPPGQAHFDYLAGDLFVRDRRRAVTVLATRAYGDERVTSNRGAARPQLNDDGTRVVFESDATDLVRGLHDVEAAPGKAVGNDLNGDGRDVFGDARFLGSMGNQHLNAPVQSLVPDRDGSGYWLVASDGGIFAFDADFRGSMGATRLN